MENRYRININFKIWFTFLLFWVLFSTASFADICPQKEFKVYVEQLDKTKIESVNRLKENYKKISFEKSKECRSLLFSHFREYYKQITQGYIASVEEKLNEKYPLSSKKEKKFKTEFKKIGLRLDEGEGMYYVEADSAWFLKEFSKGLPTEWTSYLKQWDHEAQYAFSEDGVMLISFEALRKRIIFWEKFLKKYPDFAESNSAEDALSVYLSFYLSGLHGTLSFSHIPLSSNDIRRSYENFLSQNHQSIYYEVIKSQYMIMKDNAFIVNEKTSKKLDSNYKKRIINE